jgi:hypothetical protein
MKLRLAAAWAVPIAAAIAAGCKTTTVIDKYEAAPAVIGQDESIVVLGRRTSSTHETEVDFVSCVGTHLAKGATKVNVIPEGAFLDAVYPWFESSTAPTDVKNLDKLLANDALARKFAELKIRYFVWLDGSTETTDKSGGISCAIGPGGGGCFGFASWDDAANYEASIWDLKNLNLSGKINAESQGTSYLPAIIVPIPLLARVQSAACDSMAAQLAGFLRPDAAATVAAPAPSGGCGAAQSC